MMKKLVGAATVALAVLGWFGFEPIRDYFIGEELEQAEQQAQTHVYQLFEQSSGIIGHVEVDGGVNLTYITCNVPQEVPNNAYYLTYRINGVPGDFRWPVEGYANTDFQMDSYCSDGWTGRYVFPAEAGDIIEVVWHFPVFVGERLIGNYSVVMTYKV